MIDLKEKLTESPILWGSWYFPHHFRKDSPPFHFKIIEEAQKNMFLAIGAPRESSKTTILGFLYPMLEVCNKRRHFIVVITSVYTKSCNILDTIKYELKYNQKLIDDYGITIPKDAEGDSILRHPDGFETRVLCKGRDQVGDIRGEKFGAYRPDLILIDDIEDDKMVENPDRRIELQNLFDQVILFAGEAGVTQIIVIGTILHDDSQLSKLLEPNQYKQFRKLLFKARGEENGNRKSLWGEKWSVEDLDKKEAQDPVSFAKEMQNDPVSGRRAKFHKEDFRYWRVEEMHYVLMGNENEIISKGELSTCKAAIACDLAWEEKRESDYSVILPAFLTPNSDILIESYIFKKGMRPDELQEILFSMEQRLKAITKSPVYIGFEKAKLEKVMTWLLKGEMRKRNYWLNLKELQWDADKIQRIVTRLQPRYTQHVIYHKHGMGELEHQLLRVPSGVHDDLCLVKGTKIATLFGNKNIEDVKKGDFVLTPNGIDKVIVSSYTGKKKVIEKLGLIATPNHPVFDTVKGLDKLQNICYICNEAKLNKKEILKWKYRKLLFLMEKNINCGVGKENIILLFQQQIKEKELVKDFTWRFGNLIIKKQFQKAISFTIKTIILLITHQIIWNCYLMHNIINLSQLRQKIWNYLKKSVRWLLYGINLKRVYYGIKNTVKNVGKIENIKNILVNFVVVNSNQGIVKNLNFAPTNTVKNILNPSGIMENTENVLSVENSSTLNINTNQIKPVQGLVAQNSDIQDVYNLTVDKSHLYYANNILVGNCDGLQGVVQLLEYPKQVPKQAVPETEFEWLRRKAIEAKKPRKQRYAFGKKLKPFGIPAKESFR